MQNSRDLIFFVFNSVGLKYYFLLIFDIFLDFTATFIESLTNKQNFSNFNGFPGTWPTCESRGVQKNGVRKMCSEDLLAETWKGLRNVNELNIFIESYLLFAITEKLVNSFLMDGYIEYSYFLIG